MLWALVVVLFLFWLFGAFADNFGSIVHLLLLVAAVLVVYNLVTRGRATL